MIVVAYTIKYIDCRLAFHNHFLLVTKRANIKSIVLNWYIFFSPSYLDVGVTTEWVKMEDVRRIKHFRMDLVLVCCCIIIIFHFHREHFIFVEYFCFFAARNQNCSSAKQRWQSIEKHTEMFVKQIIEHFDSTNRSLPQVMKIYSNKSNVSIKSNVKKKNSNASGLSESEK